MGRAAAQLIFDRLKGDGEQSRKVIFEPRLIVRESSVVCKR
jgi:DNA-binding LacI/PurR family transcriptional regulator